MKNNIAIIGETEQVYFIDKDILEFLQHYLCDGEVLVGFGFKYMGKSTFDIVVLDGVRYDWLSGAFMPTIYNTSKKDISNMSGVDKLTPYQIDVLYKIVDGSEIASVSEYKRNEESYLIRLREKKLDRIIK